MVSCLSCSRGQRRARSWLVANGSARSWRPRSSRPSGQRPAGAVARRAGHGTSDLADGCQAGRGTRVSGTPAGALGPPGCRRCGRGGPRSPTSAAETRRGRTERVAAASAFEVRRTHGHDIGHLPDVRAGSDADHRVMTSTHRSARALLVLAAALLAVTAPAATPAAASSTGPVPRSHLLVSGLDGAMGSTVGPDGALYVVESAAGRISRVDPRTGRQDDLRQRPARRVLDTGGAMDVAFVRHRAYVLVTLVSPDVGGRDVDGIYRVDGPDRVTVVADIGTWSLAHPPVIAVLRPDRRSVRAAALPGRLSRHRRPPQPPAPGHPRRGHHGTGQRSATWSRQASRSATGPSTWRRRARCRTSRATAGSSESNPGPAARRGGIRRTAAGRRRVRP